MRRRSPLRRRQRLRRGRPPARHSRLRRRTPLRRSPFAPASAAQRAKVAGQACIACGSRRAIDPAHLTPRSRGGCDEPECVAPLCRTCHRAFDRGELDLLPHLEPRFRAELAHALSHQPLLALLRRVTGTRWRPCENDNRWRDR
jgi:hypothetical protein